MHVEHSELLKGDNDPDHIILIHKAINLVSNLYARYRQEQRPLLPPLQ